MNTWIWMRTIPPKARHGTVLVVRYGDRRISSTMMASQCNPLMSLRESKGSSHKIDGAKKRKPISTIDLWCPHTGTHTWRHTCLASLPPDMHSHAHKHALTHKLQTHEKQIEEVRFLRTFCAFLCGRASVFTGMWSLSVKRSRLTFLMTKIFKRQKNN